MIRNSVKHYSLRQLIPRIDRKLRRGRPTNLLPRADAEKSPASAVHAG